MLDVGWVPHVQKGLCFRMPEAAWCDREAGFRGMTSYCALQANWPFLRGTH